MQAKPEITDLGLVSRSKALPHLVRVRGGFRSVCPCGWTSETKRSQSDVLDRLSAHQDMRHESWYGLPGKEA